MHPRTSLARRLAVAVALAALAVGAAAAPASASGLGHGHGHGRDDFALLQMNLCLSGLAGCYGKTQYPAVVDEAIAKIRATRPAVVTLNEACSGDVERIARETGLHQRFATVLYRGAPLPCTKPEGRGVFGNAVLARKPIVAAEDAPYTAQLGSEERRWLCVTTTDWIRTCTSHLSVAGTPEQAATNEAQCRELTAVLTGRHPLQSTFFGGDVNRADSCVPRGGWTARDEEAPQAPGIQHVYGTRPAWFARPQDEVLPMAHSDHDALLVRVKRHR